MKRSPKKLTTILALSAASISSVLAILLLLAGQARPALGQSPAATAPVPAISPYIEAHTHFDGDPEGVIQASLQALGRQNATKIFFLSPPDTFDNPKPVETDVLAPLVKKYPDKLVLLAGGGTLNPMLQQSVRSGDAGPEVQRKFRERAEELIRMGAVGFGEMTTEHFVVDTPYQYAPNDHPLLLLLADISAQHNAPIVLHMEAVPNDMPIPPEFLKGNQPQLHANIAAFERLLAHNPRAKIIWAHFGSDATGYRTPELTRRLLQAHPNLFLEIKTDPINPRKSYPLDANGKLKPDYLKLFTDFPDRFILGSDQHYPEPKLPAQRWQTTVSLFNQLPADLRRKIGIDNVARIYPLSVSTQRSSN